MTARKPDADEDGDRWERRPHTKRDRIKRLRERLLTAKTYGSVSGLAGAVAGVLDLLEDEL